MYCALFFLQKVQFKVYIISMYCKTIDFNYDLIILLLLERLCYITYNKHNMELIELA